MEVEGYDFECSILEFRSGTFSDNNKEVRHAYVFIRDDGLLLRKTGVLIKSDLGTKRLFYKDISMIDYDKAGLFHLTSDIAITMISGEIVILRYVEEEWYNLINEKWLNFKNQPTVSSSQDSTYDKIVKYAELYEKGLLTREEFEELKSQLIKGTSSNENVIADHENTLQADCCPECGNAIEFDSLFCSNCGFKLK